MKAFWMTLVVLISAIFFALAYNYFYFGADFYQKSNFLVLLLIVCLYVLGFFLGRFFPYVSNTQDVEDEEEKDAYKNIYTSSKPVKKAVSESVDFTDTQDISGGFKKDNLQLLEGIGPKVQDLLYSHGVHTFTELAGCSMEKLQGILKSGGERFILCNPDTWAYQAQLAADKNWTKLKEYQDFLLRGAE